RRAGRGRRARADGPARHPAPLPDPLPHARRRRAELLPAGLEPAPHFQPVRDRARHQPARGHRQHLLRPRRARLLPRDGAEHDNVLTGNLGM
ncbi:MAG: hypothetical protein AVDCRST_MAG45-1287, partial [uncultured Solirubrobacterales bacterium]